VAANPIEQIDLHLLRIAFPSNTTAELIHWIEPLKATCQKYGIDTVREIASFLGNIAVESADLKRLTESLNYSVEGLMKTFGRHRISAADCQRYGRSGNRPANQEMLANILYGGEFGRKQLGNTVPGDGWKFRGYGCKQLTGRSNVTRFAAAMNMTIDQALAYLRTREGSCASAGWFWKTNNLDARALTPGWDDDRKAINGGVLGLDVVEDRANALVRELLKRGC
jgi:putative chitinase